MDIYAFYPKTSVSVNDFDQIRAVDIITGAKVKDFVKNYRGISYRPYAIQDGDRPDNVAYKLYNNAKYDWIILLVNDMYSIYDDWPKSSTELERYIIAKYGSISAASSTIKYYYDADGNIIDLTTFNTLPAASRNSESVLAWEYRMNDRKRIIRIPTPSSVAKIQNDLTTLNIKPVR